VEEVVRAFLHGLPPLHELVLPALFRIVLVELALEDVRVGQR
jgi:hypothetical protein